jgi:hypothetical protein
MLAAICIFQLVARSEIECQYRDHRDRRGSIYHQFRRRWRSGRRRSLLGSRSLGDRSSRGHLNAAVCQGGFGGDGGPATNATLNHAATMALDAEGNLYIADTINHRIRKVDASTGLIHTIAGTGLNGFSGDGGPANAGEISFPVGIALDKAGRVYFADENNNRIRMLIPTQQPKPLKREPRH